MTGQRSPRATGYHSNPLFFGSVPYTTNPFTVTVQGAPYTVPVITPGTTYIKELSGVSVSGGQLTFLFGAGFMIAGIDISAGGLPTDMPLLASGVPLDDGGAAISMDMLQPVVAEAASRWSATGLTPAQTATLANVQFTVTDLGGAYLGLANPATNTIRIDNDAAMIGWSVVSGPWSVVRGPWSVVSGQWSVVSGPWSVVSGQWMNGIPGTTDNGQRTTDNGQRTTDNGQRTTDNGQRTTDGVDLLTVVMHELGHLLGYQHSDDVDGLMSPMLSASPLRLSALDSRLSTLVEPLGQTEWRKGSPSFALRPASSLDDVLTDLVQDGSRVGSRAGSRVGASELLESDGDDLLAAMPLRPGDWAAETRIPRRSRMERYQRELDAWFAELAEEEAVGG